MAFNFQHKQLEATTLRLSPSAPRFSTPGYRAKHLGNVKSELVSGLQPPKSIQKLGDNLNINEH